MPNLDTVSELRRRKLVDRDGSVVGVVEDVYLDATTDARTWAVVRIGRFAGRRAFVPLVDASPRGDAIETSFSKRDVNAAPAIEAGDELLRRTEIELYDYGIEGPARPLADDDEESVEPPPAEQPGPAATAAPAPIAAPAPPAAPAQPAAQPPPGRPPRSPEHAPAPEDERYGLPRDPFELKDALWRPHRFTRDLRACAAARRHGAGARMRERSELPGDPRRRRPRGPPGRARDQPRDARQGAVLVLTRDPVADRIDSVATLAAPRMAQACRALCDAVAC